MQQNGNVKAVVMGYVSLLFAEVVLSLILALQAFMIGFMICHTLGGCSVYRVRGRELTFSSLVGYGALSSGLPLPLSRRGPSLTLAHSHTGVSTVFVGLAEDPLALQERDPQLFETIRRTYPKVTTSVRRSPP